MKKSPLAKLKRAVARDSNDDRSPAIWDDGSIVSSSSSHAGLGVFHADWQQRSSGGSASQGKRGRELELRKKALTRSSGEDAKGQNTTQSTESETSSDRSDGSEYSSDAVGFSEADSKNALTRARAVEKAGSRSNRRPPAEPTLAPCQATPPHSGQRRIREGFSPVQRKLNFEEVQVEGGPWSFEPHQEEEDGFIHFDDDFFHVATQRRARDEFGAQRPLDKYEEGWPAQRRVRFGQGENELSTPSSQKETQDPPLTIDVVSDVSCHDDPSVDMMSSLATNDTNSLTDYNLRSSQQRRSPTTLDPHVVEEVDGDDSEKEQQREERRHDPPGTFIDDINSTTDTRNGRMMNRYNFHGRDPSVGGDSTRYSQPSIVRNQPPKRELGRGHPWEHDQQQRAAYSTNQSRSGPNQSKHSSQQLQQAPHDDDQWHIEFVNPINNHAACEASSLGNLTGEYENSPPEDDDTAANTMNTVDLVAEVKRVWRHVQKYEKKKQKKKDLMAQYYSSSGIQEVDEEPNMEAMMSLMENPWEVSLDDTGVSDLTGCSRINTGGGMRPYGAGVPNNRRSPLEKYIHNTGGMIQSGSGQSYNNASHASTEKDLAFVNDGVELFFDQSQTQHPSSIAYHPRVPLSRHHKSIHNIDDLAQPYEMTKSRSTGTALSSKTPQVSNRAPVMHQEVLSGNNTGSTSHNSPPSLPKDRIKIARKYMKQHGGARCPRSRSSLVADFITPM